MFFLPAALIVVGPPTRHSWSSLRPLAAKLLKRLPDRFRRALE
jgi:hypothetical protein